MNNRPLVTIITACYNHEEFLEDYFNSIIRQTYDNIELIIIDDASTDKSQLIIEDWLLALEKRFSRVIYLPRKTNVGVIKNCNTGLELQSGKFICFFSSDDIMQPTKIEKNVLLLEENPQYGMIYSNFLALKRGKVSKKPIRKKMMPTGNIFVELLKQINFITPLSVCIRKEVFDHVGQFDESLKCEDYPMWLKITQKFEVGYINEPLAIYRINPNSLSNTKEYNTSGFDDLIKLKKSFLESGAVNEEVMTDVLINSYFNYARISYFFNNKIKFKEYYNNYIVLNSHRNSKYYTLKILNFIIKIPWLYKSSIVFLYIYKYYSTSSLKLLYINLKNILNEH